MPSDSSDLAAHLRLYTSKLQEIKDAVESGDTGIASHIEGLQTYERQIRAVTRQWKGSPTSDEVSAFQAWREADAALRLAVDRSLEELDGNLGDLRLAQTALRAYSSLNSHTKSQRIQKKL